GLLQRERLGRRVGRRRAASETAGRRRGIGARLAQALASHRTGRRRGLAATEEGECKPDEATDQGYLQQEAKETAEAGEAAEQAAAREQAEQASAEQAAEQQTAEAGAETGLTRGRHAGTAGLRGGGRLRGRALHRLRGARRGVGRRRRRISLGA